MAPRGKQAEFWSVEVEVKRVLGGLVVAAATAGIATYAGARVNTYALVSLKAEIERIDRTSQRSKEETLSQVHRELDGLRAEIRELRQADKSKQK